MDLPAPPADSIIVAGRDEEGRLRLSWRAPARAIARWWYRVCFLSFWLCGWAVGEVAATAALVKGVWDKTIWEAPWQEVLVGWLWLGAWTVGGIVAAAFLYGLLRKPGPERITLGEEFFLHEAETLVEPTEGAPELGYYPSLRFLWGRRKKTQIPWEEVVAVSLGRVGERQRLTLKHGKDRLEIGAYLCEPEREWLAEVLRAWANSRRKTGR